MKNLNGDVSTADAELCKASCIEIFKAATVEESDLEILVDSDKQVNGSSTPSTQTIFENTSFLGEIIEDKSVCSKLVRGLIDPMTYKPLYFSSIDESSISSMAELKTKRKRSPLKIKGKVSKKKVFESGSMHIQAFFKPKSKGKLCAILNEINSILNFNPIEKQKWRRESSTQPVETKNPYKIINPFETETQSNSEVDTSSLSNASCTDLVQLNRNRKINSKNKFCFSKYFKPGTKPEAMKNSNKNLQINRSDKFKIQVQKTADTELDIK